jgi:hypothetical protein
MYSVAVFLSPSKKKWLVNRITEVKNEEQEDEKAMQFLVSEGR